MAPRKPVHGPLRSALEADLRGLSLDDHAALIELARALAEELDAKPTVCAECGGRDGRNPAMVLRYAEALDALGIGSVRAATEDDDFTALTKEFHSGRTATPHPAKP